MIFNWSIIRKELHTNVLSRSFYVFLLIFSFIIMFSFYTSDFFSESWEPMGTYIKIGFLMSLFLSAYAGYLSSVIFAWEFEKNTIQPLVVYTSRRQVFWSKTLSVFIIIALQVLLLIPQIIIIGTARGTINLYFMILFLQILSAMFIFSLGAYAIALLVAIILRRGAYSIVTGVVYGLLVIMGFFYLSSNYSPGITYLSIDYSYAWSPVHYIPYVVFGVIEWGFIPIILIIAPLVWIIPLIFLAEAYFRGCDI